MKRAMTSIFAVALALCASAFDVRMMIPRARHHVPTPSIPYIETDGTAYVDLGFTPTVNCDTELCHAYLDTEETSFMGANSVKTVNRFGITYANGIARIAIGANSEINSPIETGKYNLYKIHGQEISINEQSATVPAKVAGQTNLQLFADPYWGPLGKQRIRYFKAWESGVLIRDCVPYSGPRGVGLLDKVNDVLYTNANTSGTLTYGVEGGGLPKSPYIETDGVASYMDLGFTPTANMTFEIDFRLFAVDGVFNSPLMGSCSGTKARYQIADNTTISGQVYLTCTRPSCNIEDNCSKHNIRYDGNVVILDGVEFVQDSGTTSTTAQLLIGKSQVNSTSYREFGKARIYSAKFWESGELIRDLVPYSGPRGVGLLDRVNDVLYTNANASGTLTYGEE